MFNNIMLLLYRISQNAVEFEERESDYSGRKIRVVFKEKDATEPGVG